MPDNDFLKNGLCCAAWVSVLCSYPSASMFQGCCHRNSISGIVDFLDFVLIKPGICTDAVSKKNVRVFLYYYY